MVCQYLEEDREDTALLRHGRESDFDEENHRDASQEKNPTQQEDVGYFGGTLCTLEVGVTHIARITLSTENASVAFVAVAYWVVVLLCGSQTSSRSVAGQEGE